MISLIHVNQSHIAANTKDGGNRPVYTIKAGGRIRYAREVHIHGSSKLVYDGTRLSCGARCWLSTEAPVELIDEMSFSEAREAS